MLYGDVREGGQAMTVFFGRIGTAFGQDKRKMCGPGPDLQGMVSMVESREPVAMRPLRDVEEGGLA